MQTGWRGDRLVPESYENLRPLVALARQARMRVVNFDWELRREDLLRLRETVHFWGSTVQGRYKKFDSQMLTAINELLEEPDSAYVLREPKESPGSTVLSGVRARAAATGFAAT